MAKGGFVYGKLELQKEKNGFQIQAYTSSSAEGPFEPYMKLDYTSASENETDKDQN